MTKAYLRVCFVVFTAYYFLQLTSVFLKLIFVANLPSGLRDSQQVIHARLLLDTLTHCLTLYVQYMYRFP